MTEPRVAQQVPLAAFVTSGRAGQTVAESFRPTPQLLRGSLPRPSRQIQLIRLGDACHQFGDRDVAELQRFRID